MPSEENNGYVFPILNGIATFMQGAVAVFKKAGEWYRDNEETIRNFIINFSNFSTCCSAIEKMAQRQIMFSDDISIDFAEAICNSDNIDTLVEDYYFGTDTHHICCHETAALLLYLGAELFYFSASSFCSSSYRRDIFAKRSSERLPETLSS